MPRTWLQIKVQLLAGCADDCDPPPRARVHHRACYTFEQLARAINAAFARWDLSHLHQFELADGRGIGYPDDSYEPDLVWHDHAKLKVAREVKPGDQFEYVFDLGDYWQHRCTVADTKVDPLNEYGIVPPGTVAIFGWGSIPDQYRRDSEPDTEDPTDTRRPAAFRSARLRLTPRKAAATQPRWDTFQPAQPGHFRAALTCSVSLNVEDGQLTASWSYNGTTINVSGRCVESLPRSAQRSISVRHRGARQRLDCCAPRVTRTVVWADAAGSSPASTGRHGLGPSSSRSTPPVGAIGRYVVRRVG